MKVLVNNMTNDMFLGESHYKAECDITIEGLINTTTITNVSIVKSDSIHTVVIPCNHIKYSDTLTEMIRSAVLMEYVRFIANNMAIVHPMA